MSANMEATLKFGANKGEAIAAIDAIQKRLDKLASGATKAGNSVKQGASAAASNSGGGGMLDAIGGGAGLAAIAGIGLVTAGIYKLTTGVSAAIDRLGTLSRTARDVGTDSDSLQKLQFVGRAFGVSIETTNAALRNLRDVFPDQDSIAALEAVRAKMQEMGPGAEAASYAYEVFGYRAKELYPLLMSNNEEFDKFAEQAKNFTLDSLEIQKVEDAKEAINRLGVAWDTASENFYNQIAVKVAPIVEWLAELLENWAADTTAGTETVNWAWEAFNSTIAFTANVVQVIYGAFRAFFGFVTIGLSLLVDGLWYLAKGVDYAVEVITGNVSNMAGALERASAAMKEFGARQADAGIAALQGEWWGDKWQNKRRELESKEKNPPKERHSFDNDYVPESLQRELDNAAGKNVAPLPKAMEKASADAFSTMAKFQAGLLVDRNREQQTQNKILKVNEQIRDNIKKQKPKIAKF